MVDVIEDIKENVEEGGEAIEEAVEKTEEFAKKELRKAKKIGKEVLGKTEVKAAAEKEKVEKAVKKEERKGKGILSEIAGDVGKGVRKIERGAKRIGEGLEHGVEEIEEDVLKVGRAIKRDERKIKELPGVEEKIEKKGKSIFRKIEEGIEESAEKVGMGIKRGVKTIEKGIEYGIEEIEHDAEKIAETFRRDKRKVKRLVKGGEEKMEEGAERVEETVEKDVKKVGGVLKRDSKKVKEFAKEEVEKAKKLGKKRIRISLEEEAESESVHPGVSELEERKKLLLEKAKRLKEKVSAEEITSEELKEKVKGKKRTDMLVPLEEYVKAGIYLGTRVVTPMMRPFVYRRRADGLAIFNTDTIDEKLKEGIEYLSGFAPEDVILVCKRQAGWKAAEKFSEITGIRAFTKKYPAGILTNKILSNFLENELTIITDQWVDKNALNDTLTVRKKVLMICDTNNFSQGADKIIIGNNKSSKSLGLIFYLLARGYCKARGLSTDRIPDLEWWAGEETGFSGEETERKRTIAEAGAEFGV